MFLQAATTEGFDGFHGLSLALLVGGGIAALAWLMLLGVLWLASRPRFPDPGPPVGDLGPEPPALANMLVNRWNVTRIAMAATLVDLAGRRVLGLEDYAGGRHVVRIRSNQPKDESFTRYEQQVLDLVRSRATGNSAPVETLDLGQAAEAHGWWKRFENSVKDDARERGLARGRWTARDRFLLGAGLAIPLGLVAMALTVARVGESPDDDSTDRLMWLVFAGIAWFIVTASLAKQGALRETAAGREACARWLGVREYLRGTAAFGDLPPGSVAVWERYLAYAVGFGMAHGTARALPFDTDDPNTAWSRYGGEWRQVRISYPRRWGFGEPPWKVFVFGLGLTAFWGVIGFLILPALTRGAWDIGLELIEDQALGSRAELGLAAGILVTVVLMGSYVLYRLIDGLGRLILGAMDLGRTVTVTGEVANLYGGRVAVADGISEETRAWTAPFGAPGLRRGQLIRATMSPRLCHVTLVESLDRVTASEAESPVAEPTGARVGAQTLDAATASQITGIALTPASADSGVATFVSDGTGAYSQAFTDGADGMLKVYMTPALGGVTGFFGLVANLPGQDAIDVGGHAGTWIGERVLTVPIDGGMLGVDIELPQLDGAQKRAVALQLAEHVTRNAGRGSATGEDALAATAE